ncbi:MAG TPA: cytochrome P450 [Pseudonocardiaceae bacterium]|nr:cytochrome P450 [Pseudonocardiaceae bacterium]
MARTLPPGPPLPATVQAGLFWLIPLRFMYGCHRRYGDRFTVRVPGFGTLVYLADRDDIRTVLRGDQAIFHAGEANFPLAEILGSRSVLVADEDRHQRSRAMLLPAFHGDSVRKQVAEMAEITAADVAHWPVGEPFALLARTQAITLEIILRTVIGVHDEGRLGALREALPPMVEIGSPLELLPPPRILRRVGMWRRRAQRQARAHALLLDEIARCRQDPDLPRRTDVLAMLVRTIDTIDTAEQPMSDRELVDQLVTLLLAGHETTAAALAWTFERLTRSPDLLDRTAQAAVSGDTAWLDAVCRESLRSRPVVFQIGRKLTEPFELAGYHLPAGTMVAPAINLVHHHGRYYPEPEEFRPQRFVGTRPDTSVWLPFGGGVRRCLGATFAQVEMRTVIQEVLRRVELEPTTAPDEQVRVRHVTLVPRDGAVVHVRRHLAAAEPPAARVAAG